MIQLPDDSKRPAPSFLIGLVEALSSIGRPLLVGGCVRDWVMDRAPKDYDIEVFGASQSTVDDTLSQFGSVDPVGRSFGVIKFRRDGIDFDISLPRRERKSDFGHRGFEVEVDPGMSPSDALARRDFTMNAMAVDPATGELLDPFGGRDDITRKMLKHTSAAFTEDPLRVLRGFQFAGRFNFRLDPLTATICAGIKAGFRELPVERVWGEWAKWAADSIMPSAGIRALEDAKWLEHFPEVAQLKGVEQEPEWHPEGNVLLHTCHCIDALVGFPEWEAMELDERRILMFAVLSHDFGKAVTTTKAERHGRQRWISPGHEAESGVLAASFLARIGAPTDFGIRVRNLVENHHAHFGGPVVPSPASVRRLAKRLDPATLAEWLLVLRADHLGRPPLISQETQNRIDAWAGAATEMELRNSAPKPILLGRHLVQAGLAPGPAFKPILDEAFEAQLDGRFTDASGAIAWLQLKLGGEKMEME